MTINTDGIFFIPLRPLRNCLGIISYTSSNDREHITECKLQPYRFSEFAYKLIAVPVEDNGTFERKTFYTNDFKQLLRDGYIVEKTKETMRVEIQKHIITLSKTVFTVVEEEVLINE